MWTATELEAKMQAATHEAVAEAHPDAERRELDVTGKSAAVEAVAIVTR